MCGRLADVGLAEPLLVLSLKFWYTPVCKVVRKIRELLVFFGHNDKITLVIKICKSPNGPRDFRLIKGMMSLFFL